MVEGLTGDGNIAGRPLSAEVGRPVDVFGVFDDETSYTTIELFKLFGTLSLAELSELGGEVCAKTEMIKSSENRVIPMNYADGMYSRGAVKNTMARELAQFIFRHSGLNAVNRLGEQPTAISGAEIKERFRLTPAERLQLGDPRNRGVMSDDEKVQSLNIFKDKTNTTIPFQVVGRLARHIAASLSVDRFDELVNQANFSPKIDATYVSQVSDFVQAVWRNARWLPVLDQMLDLDE